MNSLKNSLEDTVILVVDDTPDVLAGLATILRQRHPCVLQATSGQQALDIMAHAAVDLVVTDIAMAGMDGMELLSRVREGWPNTQVIMITGFGSIETAVEAMKRGAYHYVAKPFRAEEILIFVDRALQRRSLEREVRDLRNKLSQSNEFAGIITQSKKMLDIFEFIRKVAPTDAPVLIRGESGTGKELVAKAIHQESNRSQARFLGINAAALPEQLLEAELFGYKKGAFTGANDDKKGLLASARGGTVFLDEISRMPVSCQAKLLRAIEEREVLPVGGLKIERVEVRFVSATNAAELAQIRDDLYYRLGVMEVHVPALRERMEDVALLTTHFLKMYSRRFNRGSKHLTANSLAVLMDYNWPGNVRELENVVQRAVVMSRDEEIAPEDLWIHSPAAAHTYPAAGTLPQYIKAKQEALGDFQHRYVDAMLKRTGGNISKASQLAGITRAAFYSIMKKNGFEKGQSWKAGNDIARKASGDSQEINAKSGYGGY
ncbi:MAG: sigma-54-dependent Fis family transcriptional regulator [Planctomycetes bacterium]|nr:sigma-54-dependent Fis family transcriptional regulator [Planctomycetota bacterium]